MENIQKKELPDFIIVGTMKSGTTTLQHYLLNHDDISMPKKELHFFNRDSNFEKGLEYYRQLFLEDCEDELKIIGEKTPTYSYLPSVPKRIYDTTPNAKLIWILRNPIDRAYSNYLHALSGSVEWMSFENAIKKEPKRIEKNIFKGYRERGIYHQQIERFLKYFPNNQMYYLLFEDLIKNPKTEVNRLLDFLGTSNHKNISLKLPHKNKSSFPRFPILQYGVRKFLGKNNLIYKGVSRWTVKKKKISDELRIQLREFYKPHNEKLSEMIGKDLSIWN